MVVNKDDIEETEGERCYLHLYDVLACVEGAMLGIEERVQNDCKTWRTLKVALIYVNHNLLCDVERWTKEAKELAEADKLADRFDNVEVFFYFEYFDGFVYVVTREDDD